MSAKFKIQKIADDGARAYVTATIVAPAYFAVSDASRLAGLPLESFLAEPSPRIFVFELRYPGDAAELQPGSVVILD